MKAFVVMFVFFLLGCSSAETILTEKDDGKKINLKQGDIVVLKLSETSGTGYGWSVVKNDEKVFKTQGEPETEKPDGKPIPGGKITKVWRFKAEMVGTSDLEMHHAKVFGKDKTPTKTFKLSVKVE